MAISAAVFAAKAAVLCTAAVKGATNAASAVFAAMGRWRQLRPYLLRLRWLQLGLHHRQHQQLRRRGFGDDCGERFGD